LIVDHVEDVATHLPMVSRILHLLVIDILAVGVAMRRNPEGIALLDALGGEDQITTTDGADTVVVSVIVNGPESAVVGGRTIVDQSSPVIGC